MWDKIISGSAKGRDAHPKPPAIYGGEDLAGKRVLVWCDQGIGDEILYSSMYAELIARAEFATIEAEDRLVPVFRRSFPQAAIVPRNQGGADHDYQMSTGHLGRLLRPDAAAFPFRLKYLRAPESLSNELGLSYQWSAGTRDVVGIAWRSANKINGDIKSAYAIEFEELFKRPDIFVASLQYGEVTPEVEGLPVYVHPFIDQVESLDDAFAQVSAMDVVVTTSNTTAHIAGALGVKTALLLPLIEPERLPWYWRWGAGDTTPWYPNMRIFRGEGDRWCRDALNHALKWI